MTLCYWARSTEAAKLARLRGLVPLGFHPIGEAREHPSQGVAGGLPGQIWSVGDGTPAGVGLESTPGPRGTDGE
jgi:hypothetical protein